MKSSKMWFVLLPCVFWGCAVEAPARRSAVDSSKLCGNDPERPVFAGQCLRTDASARPPNSSDSERVEANPTGQGQPSGVPTGQGQPSGVPTEQGQPSGVPTGQGQPSGVPTEQGQPSGVLTGQGQPSGVLTGQGQPSGVPTEQVPRPSISPKDGPDAEGQAAKEKEILADIVKGLGDALLPVLKGETKPKDPKPEGSSEPSGEAVSFTIEFSQQSFVGIADGSVVKNCLIAKGTKIVVQKEPEKITEFSDFGVNQFITGEVLEIADAKDSCSLKGRDIVYLGAHATVGANSK